MSHLHSSTECFQLHGLVRDFGGPRPKITVLCGSTRFYDKFQEANYELTMLGHIVLSVGFYPHAVGEHGHGEGVGHDSAEKVELDELHKRKIDLADEVYVLNATTDEQWAGYIGESTRAEIVYAYRLGKPIKWLTPMTAGPFAELLPEDLRAGYWRKKVTQYFDEQLGELAEDAVSR